MGRLILFVCDGNIFRSAVALATARQLAAMDAVLDRYEFGAAALSNQTVGQPPEATTITEMLRYGVDISMYRAHKLTAEEAHAASLIVVMTREQAALIAACFAASEQRIVLLGDLADGGLETPDVGVGGRESIPVRVAQIRRRLQGGWTRLLALADRDTPVWQRAPVSERIVLRPYCLPDNTPCPSPTGYRYVTTAPDPRPDPRWSVAEAPLTLRETGLDIQEVALEPLPRVVHVTSGGVIWGRTEGVFCLQENTDGWRLPRVPVADDETMVEAATRAAEPVGSKVTLVDYLHRLHRIRIADRPLPWVAHYYLFGTSSTANTRGFRWFSDTEAMAKIHSREATILRMALARTVAAGVPTRG